MRFLRRLWQRNARSVRYARHSRGMCGNARTWRGIVRTIYLLAQELHYTRELHAPISTGSLEEKSSRCAHARVAQQKSRGFKTHADTRTPPITPASARVVSVQCCGKSEIFEAPLDPKNILPLNMPVESFEFKEKWYFINRLVEYTYLSRRNSRRGNFTRESDLRSERWELDNESLRADAFHRDEFSIKRELQRANLGVFFSSWFPRVIRAEECESGRSATGQRKWSVMQIRAGGLEFVSVAER